MEIKFSGAFCEQTAAAAAQVMKTYHMYHAETISAETKLREAERQEERVKGVSGMGGGGEPVFSLRIEERHQRRNAARKMEKMREKVQKEQNQSNRISPE